MNELFNTIVSRITNYLKTNNITCDDIYYRRNIDGKSSLGIKVIKGLKDNLENYVVFDFELLNNDINFNVNADKKLHRQALILVRYLSEDIVYFFESMEEYILKAGINENILLESNGISISNNIKKY